MAKLCEAASCKRRYYGFQSNWTDQRRDPARAFRSDPLAQGPARTDAAFHHPRRHHAGYSKIYISVLDEEKQKDALRGLKSAGGWLRRELGSSLQLRYTPELVFELDDSLKYGAHMFDLLSKLEAEQKEKAGETGNDEA